MPSFSARSLDRLNTCDHRLQEVLLRVIQHIDFTVLCGHRDEAAQTKAVDEKRSQVSWPNSKHNSYPSKAVDLAPWPIIWEDHSRFYWLQGQIVATAREMGIELRFGGDWDGDGRLNYRDGSSFIDLPHVEVTD
jgi:hypothetical protein